MTSMHFWRHDAFDLLFSLAVDEIANEKDDARNPNQMNGNASNRKFIRLNSKCRRHRRLQFFPLFCSFSSILSFCFCKICNNKSTKRKTRKNCKQNDLKTYVKCNEMVFEMVHVVYIEMRFEFIRFNRNCACLKQVFFCLFPLCFVLSSLSFSFIVARVYFVLYLCRFFRFIFFIHFRSIVMCFPTRFYFALALLNCDSNIRHFKCFLFSHLTRFTFPRSRAATKISKSKWIPFQISTIRYFSIRSPLRTTFCG